MTPAHCQYPIVNHSRTWHVRESTHTEDVKLEIGSHGTGTVTIQRGVLHEHPVHGVFKLTAAHVVARLAVYEPDGCHTWVDADGTELNTRI